MMKIVSFDSVFLVLYLFIYYAYIYGMLRVLGAFRYERGFFFVHTGSTQMLDVICLTRKNII